jgi:hypothetical protein
MWIQAAEVVGLVKIGPPSPELLHQEKISFPIFGEI